MNLSTRCTLFAVLACPVLLIGSAAPAQFVTNDLVYYITATNDSPDLGWDTTVPGPINTYELDPIPTNGGPALVSEGQATFYRSIQQSAYFEANGVDTDLDGKSGPPPVSIGSWTLDMTVRRLGPHYNIAEQHVASFGNGGIGAFLNISMNPSGSEYLFKVEFRDDNNNRDTRADLLDMRIGEWHHLTFTYQDSTAEDNNDGIFTAYDNGVVVTQFINQTAFFDGLSFTSFYAGAINAGEGNRNLRGDIGFIRLYDNALSQAQVTSNVNATASEFCIGGDDIVFEVVAADDPDTNEIWEVGIPGPLGTYSLTSSTGNLGIVKKETVNNAVFYSAAGNNSAAFMVDDVPPDTVGDWSYEILIRQRGPSFFGENAIGGFRTAGLSSGFGSHFVIFGNGGPSTLISGNLIGHNGTLGGNRNSVNDMVDIGLGEWHHLVFTYSNATTVGDSDGELTVYDNGEVVNVYTNLNSVYGPDPANTEEVPLFAIAAGEINRNFNGDIALTRIYKKTLSAGEVSTAFSAVESDFLLDLPDCVFEVDAASDNTASNGWDVAVPGPLGTHVLEANDGGNGTPLYVDDGDGEVYMTTVKGFADTDRAFFAPDNDVPTLSFQDFTVEILLRRRGAAGEMQIFAWGDETITAGDGSQFTLSCGGDSGLITADLMAGGGANGNRRILAGTADIDRADWHHLVYAYEDGTSIGDSNSVLTVYNNGVVANVFTTDTFYAASPDNVESIRAFIVAAAGEPDREFRGDIALVRMYQTTLDQDAVTSNFTAVADSYQIITTNTLLLHVDAANDNSETATQESDGWDLLPGGTFELEAREGGNGKPVKTTEGSATFFSSAGSRQSARFFMDGTNTDGDGKGAAKMMNVDNFTLELIVRRRGNSYLGENSIFGMRDAASVGFLSVWANPGDGLMNFDIRGTSGAVGFAQDRVTLNNIFDIGLDEWHHVVFVWTDSTDEDTNDATLTVYDNNTVVTNFTDLNTYLDLSLGITETVGVGVLVEGESNRNFNGDIGLVRLYKEPFNAAQVDANFLENAADFGLIPSMDFDISDVSLSPGGGIVITWPGVSGESYTIDRATDLLTTGFGAITSGIPGLEPSNVYTDEAPAAPDAAYRVILE